MPENKENLDQTQQVAELQKALQALQEQSKLLAEQNKQLLDKQKMQDAEKVELAKKALEEKKKAEQDAILKDSDLERLLKGLDESSGEAEKTKEKKTVDQLSNEELLGVVSESVEKFVDAKIRMDKEEREKTQDGFLKKLSNVESMLGHIVATQSLQDLAGKYPDFQQYKEDIVKLIQENPTLSLEKAYKLAKAERMDKEPALQNTETELPDIGPSGLPIRRRTAGESEQGNRNMSGLAGFRSILAEGAARALASRTKRER